MTLTLEQVREAGRFAKHDGDDDYREYSYLTRDGSGRFYAEYIGADGWSEVTSPEEYELPLVGWTHESGCDCEFCKPMGADAQPKGQSR